MPNFEITSPDGTKYQVTAPEGATEADALARVKAQHDVSTSAPDVSFPNDAPGTTYGNILPFATNDKTGAVSLAVPEAIRAPVRGFQSLFEKAKTGFAPQSSDVDQRVPTPDEIDAITTLARPAVRVGPPGVRGPAPTPEITPERAALAQDAVENFKIPLTAPQIGTSRGIKQVADILPGGGAQQAGAQQAFTRAVTKTFGEDSPVITQTVMDTAKKRIGGEMDRIEQGNDVALDDTFTNDIAAIEKRAAANLTEQEQRVLSRQVDNALENIKPGDTISGENFGALMHRGSALDDAITSPNANIAKYASEIKEALQDALERSLTPEDATAYQQARFQYKNMKTVEPLVNKSADGAISPTLLNAQVTKNFSNRAYDTGGNPLDRLAKIGQAFLKEPQSTGSGERAAILGTIGKIGSAVAGGSAVAAAAALPQAAGAAAVGYGLSRGVGAFMRRPGAANALIERGLNPAAGRMNYGVQSGAPVALGGQVPANALSYGNQPVNSLAFARDRARK